MATLQTVIERNNATVGFLREHDLDNALVSCVEAMRLFQDDRRQVMLSRANLSPIGTVTPDLLDQFMLLTDVDTSEADDPDCKDDKRAFVYDHGIEIPPSTASSEMVGPIIIFNTALVYQLYAQHCQDKDVSQQYFRKSKALYELACRVDNKSVLDHSVLFQFVVLNNVAVILSQTGSWAQSKQHFEHLLSVQMLLVDQGSWSKLCRLRGFLRNIPFEVQSAPAA